MDHRQVTDSQALQSMDSQIPESPRDEVLQEDMELLIKEETALFERFRNKTVFVTGATGLLGSQLIKALLWHRL